MKTSPLPNILQCLMGVAQEWEEATVSLPREQVLRYRNDDSNAYAYCEHHVDKSHTAVNLLLESSVETRGFATPISIIHLYCQALLEVRKFGDRIAAWNQSAPPQVITPVQPTSPLTSETHLNGSYYAVTMAGNWILTFSGGNKVVSQSGLGIGTYKYKITANGKEMSLESVFEDDDSLTILCGDCTSSFSYDKDTDTFRFLDYTFAKYSGE